MHCYGGIRTEEGPYGTLIMRKHSGCVDDDVMAGGWCQEITIVLTPEERKLPDADREALIGHKWADASGRH